MNKAVNIAAISNESVESRKPTPAILSAALAGLMCMGSGCGKEDSKKEDVATPTTPQVTSKVDAPDLTFAKFSEDCLTRGGLVETHASCGGASSCKGISFNKFSKKLVEHTCKGGNTCGGMSCIDMPSDTALEGAALYGTSCKGCHSGEMEVIADGNNNFKIYTPKGSDTTQAVENFKIKSKATLASIVAFGTHGVNSSGVAYSNMPAYYKKYSRAEIERVVDHLLTLTPVASEYDTLGEE